MTCTHTHRPHSLACKKSTFDWMISGARYSGVPHNVHVRSEIFLAKPKSVIMRCPSWQFCIVEKIIVRQLGKICKGRKDNLIAMDRPRALGTKVGWEDQYKMFLVNEKVFWFEISVDDGERVEVLQGRDNLRCIELSRAHWELAGVSEVTEQLPTADEGEEHVETVGVLVAPQ